MKRENFDKWEDEFVALCEEKLEEEPFYPYEHLWRQNMSVKEAFDAYIKENDDYAEKYCELNKTSLSVLKAADDNQEKAFLEKAKALIAVAEKTSKYCPECGRKLEKKKICKCGYSRR